MLSHALWLLLVTGVSSNPLSRGKQATPNPPTATLLPDKNSDTKTVFVGCTLPEFKQDVFLGIKYANEPIRFTPSELKTAYAANDSNSGPYDTTGTGIASSPSVVYYNATEYGYDCPGYGSDTTKLVDLGLIHLDEDCLNLNVIRPRTGTDELLPVMLWIFGGGWQQGATADPRYEFLSDLMVYITQVNCLLRYNMSYIIQQGALNGKPVLGVSINYRLAAFGFLDSKEVRVSSVPC